MKNLFLISILFNYCFSVSKSNNIPKYYELINNAELLICIKDFNAALENYKNAFNEIKKPFGKGVFNAALCAQYSKKIKDRNEFLQIIINNSDNLNFVKSTFTQSYMTKEEWQQLENKRKLDYSASLRNEFLEIRKRDQLFRPMYDTHDDTIKANEKINIKRILKINDSIGFPSHIELGYANYLRGQNHDIVLHHISQRRSRDKSVMDLETLMLNAVKEGRLDPETAIFYMNFQNDAEKGPFEVLSVWQYKHPLLADSLNNKVWVPDLKVDYIEKANKVRKQWHANTLGDIRVKADFLSVNSMPFIFSSVRKSVANLKDDFDKEMALEQYKMATKQMKEY